MRKTKNITVCLDIETIKKLNEYSKKNSINKSALINNLIIKEIEK